MRRSARSARHPHNIGVILRRGDNKFSGLVEDLVVSVVVSHAARAAARFSQGYELAGNQGARLPTRRRAAA